VSTLDAYLEGLEDGVVSVDSPTLAMLRRQTGRLARLCDDMAAVSRAEEHQLDLHPCPAPPAQLVAAAVQAAADRFADRGVTLATDVDKGLPEILGDPDRVAQVLGNLLDNALRHTPIGGVVSVGAHVIDEDTGVEFTVTDTGEGIPAEHLPHLFERFYRVDSARDRAHGGSGIGLAIVKALVEAHHGTVAASSSGIGGGATFAVRFPAARPEARC
jgi:two-component system, OmpR family, sensor histidine kinase BaeS